MKKFNRKVAAITGAGSGMGRALAIQLADLGCHLAIADIDREGLEETYNIIGKKADEIACFELDVSDRQKVYDFASDAHKHHEHIDIVINNAGISSQISIEAMSYAYFESLMNVNFWGVVYGCKAFLPMLQKRPEAHIVNVSSTFALAAFPNHAAYNASKAAVRSFTETLAAELMGSSIGVSCVIPGAVRTNIVHSSEVHGSSYLSEGNFVNDQQLNEKAKALLEAYYDDESILSAEQAAKIIIDGIKDRKRRILVGPDAFELDELVRRDPDNYLDTIASYDIFSMG